jgi:hypothetical protein
MALVAQWFTERNALSRISVVMQHLHWFVAQPGRWSHVRERTALVEQSVVGI